MSNIRKIATLNLGKNKVDLMQDSVFGRLSSVTNKRESSGTLVAVLCKYYDPSKEVFELNDKTRFSFCTKEIANTIGIKDSGIDYQEYIEQYSDVSSEYPKYLMDLRAKFVGDAGKRDITVANMKDILREMTVDDDESMRQFRELMTYYLIEEVLLCSSNAKIPRKTMWWTVRNLEACESVNWAKATEDHLHTSMANAKAWLEAGAYGEHSFVGAAPVLEAIIYDRIPKMRPPPPTWSTESPPIQKYKSQRNNARDWIEGKLSQLASTDIVMCPHCTASSGSPLAVENTPAFSMENSPLRQRTGLSLFSIDDADVAGTSSDDAATTTSDVADLEKPAQIEDVVAQEDSVEDEAAVRKSRHGRKIKPSEVFSRSPNKKKQLRRK
ncbi:hypothetical protein Tco_1460060 [Tanacetum coccineum]